MSKLDVAKEKIAYLKMWLGLALAAGVSLAGWFAGNVANIAWQYTVAAIAGFASIAFLCFKLHKTITFQINRLEKL